MFNIERFPWRDRFKKTHLYFCPPPPQRGGNEPGENTIDKIRSALGIEYIKNLHYTIAHLRRADGALIPRTERGGVGSMNLLAEKQRCG